MKLRWKASSPSPLGPNLTLRLSTTIPLLILIFSFLHGTAQGNLNIRMTAEEICIPNIGRCLSEILYTSFDRPPAAPYESPEPNPPYNPDDFQTRTTGPLQTATAALGSLTAAAGGYFGSVSVGGALTGLSASLSSLDAAITGLFTRESVEDGESTGSGLQPGEGAEKDKMDEKKSKINKKKSSTINAEERAPITPQLSNGGAQHSTSNVGGGGEGVISQLTKILDGLAAKREEDEFIEWGTQDEKRSTKEEREFLHLDELVNEEAEQEDSAERRIARAKISGIYMEPLEKDEVLVADSYVLRLIEEMLGDNPTTHPFVEARRSLQNTQFKVKPLYDFYEGLAEAQDEKRQADKEEVRKGKKDPSSMHVRDFTNKREPLQIYPIYAVTQGVEGSGPAGNIEVLQFSLPKSSRKGPRSATPWLSEVLGKKRTPGMEIGGVISNIEGLTGSYPVRMRKFLDESSPFWMQAASDFFPVGSWLYNSSTDRPCPHLFNFNVRIPVPGLFTSQELHLTFADAIVTDIKITMPDEYADDARPYEDIYFMYRGILWTWYNGNDLVASGSSVNGFRNGIPPVPIPGGTEGCCEELPWTIQPFPNCTLWQIPPP